MRYLVERHGYATLEQSDITDPDNVIAEDHLWAFLEATQKQSLDRLRRDYGSDTRDEVFKALRVELRHAPLWLTMRAGLTVRGVQLQLFYPPPRSTQSAAAANFAQNRLSLRHHFYFGAANKELDILLFLNGLPVVAIELKHEANQTVEDAVRQFVQRDHSHRLFSHPFLYIAADTSDVKAATDPRRAENFIWHNAGLPNKASSPDEYPIEHLYRDTFSPTGIFNALSFFLVHAPERPAEDSRPARPAYTIFPRYHQSRMVSRVASEATRHFADHGNIGRKFLINHSAGSGKTLSICWLADHLQSLYRPGTDDRLVDIVFILTDRKSLDTNVREDLANFLHLAPKVGLARKSEDLPLFLKQRKSIIVTTQQKFAWILDKLKEDASLRELRVAFLIDEAHRSQEGKQGASLRVPFRSPDQPDQDDVDIDDEAEIAKIIREHDANQLFVAFTATPAPATTSLFGDPFDTYSEEEAIHEGYIVDVAQSIFSYATLYNLHCPVVVKPEDARLYPAGVVAKALKTVAYQDESLIQYKAEVMLRIFEASVKPLLDGRAKAMIVASSRLAGLRYYKVIVDKLRERNADYRVLFAFSDFDHPETNKHITEVEVNGLAAGELIEDRFEGDEYRIMVVANKFQTGFDQPLLAGMFLDKPVADRNAVQTVSRLNRKDKEGLKRSVVVVDFTNNARAILKAFGKYRKGAPLPAEEPDEKACVKLLEEIRAKGVFEENDAAEMVNLIANGTDAQRQHRVAGLRSRFEGKLGDLETRKAFVYLLAKFAKSYVYLTAFFRYPKEIGEFAVFADFVGPQLIKEGKVSELMKLVRQTEVVKVAVKDQGEVHASSSIKLTPGGGGKGAGVPPKKVTVQDVIEGLLKKFVISDDEALFIRQVIEDKAADPAIRQDVTQNRGDVAFLNGPLRTGVNHGIQATYSSLGRYDELADPRYLDEGAIFDSMAAAVIDLHLAAA